MRNYSIEPETIADMLQYCNLTPAIIEEITSSMTSLMDTFESVQKNLVTEHVSAYRELLTEFSELLKIVIGDVDEATTMTRTKALRYQSVLSKKIR